MIVNKGQIKDNIQIRTVVNKKDKQDFVELSTTYNNAFEGATCKCLIEHHPRMTDENFQVVEDKNNQLIVSTTCLIPWTINYEGVLLEAALLEMVLTHPDYRGRGLVRSQVDFFHRMVQEKGFDFSFIWGIPYYYRQFGYSYAIEGLVTEHIHRILIPESAQAVYGLSLKRAKKKDIPDLTRYFAKMKEGLDIFVDRSVSHWEYMIDFAKFPVFIVTGRNNETLGYVILQTDTTTQSINILESSLENATVAYELLVYINLNMEGEIYVSWPQNSYLTQVVKSLGSVTIKNTQWLFRIHDLCAFLLKIDNVLEKRLEAAGLHDLNDVLVINLFKSAYEITIEDGKVITVKDVGFRDSSMGADGGDLLIPQDAFVQYLMGYRNLEELRDIWPDIVVKNSKRYILEALFKKSKAYLYTPYHFLGPI